VALEAGGSHQVQPKETAAMTTHRNLTAVALAGMVALLLTGLAAGPASAHGAMTNPISRQAACGPEGGKSTRSRACQVALDGTGERSLDAWDTIRAPGVAGNDRERIPDGRLCSGGIDAFSALDAARTDWPSTRLAAGAEFTFRYRATIPHQGTFRLYVTADGYTPSEPLTWSDLEREPFLTATGPPLRDGSYRIEGTLPAAKTGHHVIYAIWQNSDTPDTYYSCSDVVFTAKDSAASGPDPGSRSESAPQLAPPPDEEPATDAGLSEPAATTRETSPLLYLVAAAAVLVILAGAAAVRHGRS
jgi:predicted carbohydrate-binding protein with CBM5 and CBM33 domain